MKIINCYNKLKRFMDFTGRNLNFVNGHFVSGDKSILCVGKNCKFKSIQDAVNEAEDTVKHPVIIKVMPGIYPRVHIGGRRYLNIVGDDNKRCIIKDDTGEYQNAPLEIEGSSSIENFQIISTHKLNKNKNIELLRSYAVHADFLGRGICKIKNCILKSYQNAALGCGLYKSQTVELENCMLYSYTPTESSMIKNGSLFCHNRFNKNVNNQNLIVKKCNIYTENNFAMYINDCNKELGKKANSQMEVTFINTNLYNNANKEIINKELPDNNLCFSGQIKLSKGSYGNNIKELNS